MWQRGKKCGREGRSVAGRGGAGLIRGSWGWGWARGWARGWGSDVLGLQAVLGYYAILGINSVATWTLIPYFSQLYCTLPHSAELWNSLLWYSSRLH